ncbi:MAG: hypothetical protein QM270_08365 [Bacillota bacterium]|nr:hypothetical protein [Bacillota bacterium]
MNAHRKKLSALLIIIVAALTACQTVEQAFEDTFSTRIPRHATEPEAQEKSLGERISALLWDESNRHISFQEILEDAQDRMGFAFSGSFQHDVLTYLREHEITGYLPEDEILHIAQLSDASNLLLNRTQRRQAITALREMVGNGDVYVYDGWTMIDDNTLWLWIVSPLNPEHIDTYRYQVDAGVWKAEPYKTNHASNAPMEAAVLLSEMPFDSIDQIMETAMALLEDAGEKRPFDNTNMTVGLNSLIGRIRYDNAYTFTGVLRTSREDRHLEFDRDGLLSDGDE